MPKLTELFPDFNFLRCEMESWKYTSLRSLRDAEFTAIDQPSPHIDVLKIKESHDQPLHLRYSYQNNRASLYHVRIHVVENANIDIILDHSSHDDTACFSSIVTEIILEKNASLSLHKKQTLNKKSFLIDHIAVHQSENSSFLSFTLDKGAALSYTDFLVHLNETHATSALHGVNITSGQQISDHHSVIYHHASHNQSIQNYRGIANDSSKAIFNGKTIIEKNVKKSIVKQLSKNLLLSHHADIDAKPELEIYADDIKASHGATVGQLDQQALFYLQARGMSLDEAKNLLIQGFIEEVLLTIKNKEIQENFIQSMRG